MTQNIRTRFAPSPTGYLHVGSLRTALYAFLCAKHAGGEFVLRIEDTDQTRLVEGATENLITMLETFHVSPDEGPHKDGGYGPYVQSERLPIYHEYLERLVEEGKAYYCFCTSERLDEVRKEREMLKLPPRYDGHCRSISLDEAKKRKANGEACTIRLKVEPGEWLTFKDAIRGKISFNTNEVDDVILLKSDGFPTYHGAVVIDDYLMKITHVLRGDEWISSTPKQMLLARALGVELPVYGHLPNIMGTDGKKLSKRTGDTAAELYLQKGYLVEALLNFIALLGWHPGKGEMREIFSLAELIERFDLEHVHKAGAVFGINKLNWMNGQYIKKLPLEDLYSRSIPFFEQKEWFTKLLKEKQEESFLKRVLTVEQERLERLDQVGENNRFLFTDEITVDSELLKWKEMTDDDVRENLTRAKELLEKLPTSDWQSLETLEKILLEAAGDKRGEFLWPLRVALTGEKKSPPPHQVAWVLGREETLKRIEKVIGA